MSITMDHSHIPLSSSHLKDNKFYKRPATPGPSDKSRARVDPRMKISYAMANTGADADQHMHRLASTEELECMEVLRTTNNSRVFDNGTGRCCPTDSHLQETTMIEIPLASASNKVRCKQHMQAPVAHKFWLPIEYRKWTSVEISWLWKNYIHELSGTVSWVECAKAYYKEFGRIRKRRDLETQWYRMKPLDVNAVAGRIKDSVRERRAAWIRNNGGGMSRGKRSWRDFTKLHNETFRLTDDMEGLVCEWYRLEGMNYV